MTHFKTILKIIWNAILKILRIRFPETSIIEDAVNKIIKEERRNHFVKYKRTVKKLKWYLDINQNLKK